MEAPSYGPSTVYILYAGSWSFQVVRLGPIKSGADGAPAGRGVVLHQHLVAVVVPEELVHHRVLVPGWMVRSLRVHGILVSLHHMQCLQVIRQF